jgi:hypothetical protein
MHEYEWKLCNANKSDIECYEIIFLFKQLKISKCYSYVSVAMYR